MPIPARNKSLFSYFISSSLALLLFLLISAAIPSPAGAQSQVPSGTWQNLPQYAAPNFNSDVPLNQHTFAQAAMIEAISSVFCLITGIDPVSPQQGCLDIDPGTGKLGIASPMTGEPKPGGLIGLIPDMFEQVYIPPASSANYIRYLASNFGIVKPVQAADPPQPTGFKQLEPIQSMWISVRNVTYLLFVLVFVIIGLGIMLRVKIDPRTVMTLQNQIPRIIICILLITFSYAIVGLMVDLMWTTTYMGINVLTMSNEAVTNPVGCDPEEPGSTLQKRATQGLRETPLTYGDRVLQADTEGFLTEGMGCGGIWGVTKTMGRTIEAILTGLLKMAFTSGEATPKQAATCNFDDIWNNTTEGARVKSLNECGKLAILGPVWGAAAAGAGYSIGDLLIPVAGWLAKIAAFVVIVLIVIWNLFRIWLQLVRAYIMMILYAISAPLWIIMGLLPSRPLGFEKWFRRIFANLAVFPATALLLVMAAILINGFKNSKSDGSFVPPLVGNPNMQDFGYLLAFGILLVAPGLLDIIRSSVNAVGKQGQMAIGSIQTTANQGTAPMRAIGRSTWKRTLGVNPYTGKPGAILQWAAGRNATSPLGKVARAIGRFQGADPAQMQPRKKP